MSSSNDTVNEGFVPKPWRLTLTPPYFAPPLVSPKVNAALSMGSIEVENEDESFPALSRRRRLIYTSLIGSMFFFGGTVTTILAPYADDIVEEFGVAGPAGDSLAPFVSAIFDVGWAVGAILVPPLTDRFGRANLFHVSGFLFGMTNLLAWSAGNIGTLLVFRLLCGTAGVSTTLIGAAIIADITQPAERGRFIDFVSMMDTLGGVLGPVIGIFLERVVPWRELMVGLSLLPDKIFVSALMSTIIVKETHRETLQKQRKVKKSDEKQVRFLTVLSGALKKPLELLWRSPVLILVSAHAAIGYGLSLMVVTTVEATMTENYHLPENQLWVVYLGQLVGILVGTVLSATLQPVSEILLRRRSSGSPVEEHRLALLAFVSLFWPVGFLGYGWSIERLLPVAVPIVFTGVLGIVRVIMLNHLQVYILNIFTNYPASALAGFTAVRTFGGAVIPLGAGPIYDSLGFGSGNTVLAILTGVIVLILLVVIVFGERIRARYPAEQTHKDPR